MREYNDYAIEAMVRVAIVEVGIMGTNEAYINQRFPNVTSADDIQTIIETANNVELDMDIKVVDASPEIAEASLLASGTVLEYEDTLGQEYLIKMFQDRWVLISSDGVRGVNNDTVNVYISHINMHSDSSAIKVHNV